MHLFPIPQCSIQNRNTHFFSEWSIVDMEEVHSGIYGIGLLGDGVLIPLVPGHSGKTRLLMPWLFVCQVISCQWWHWLYVINGSLSSIRKHFKYIWLLRSYKWSKMQIYYVSLKRWGMERLTYLNTGKRRHLPFKNCVKIFIFPGLQNLTNSVSRNDEK